MGRSSLDLPRRFRPIFFFGYLLAQLGLLWRAQSTPDLVFGFQMFNASSALKVSLFRRLQRRGRPRLLPVRDGQWQVRARDGQRHTYRWRDRVHDGVLGQLDRFVHASYGLDAQLYRLPFALRDLASHVPEDRETKAFVAVVDTLKNGRTNGRFRFEATR